MFTGLIEEIGKVSNISFRQGGAEITVKASVVTRSLAIGDSISINGACQTVIGFSSDSLTVEAVEETLKKTNFRNIKTGDMVNLESSLTLSKKLGGHIVLGHIDTTGKIKKIQSLPSAKIVEIEYPSEFFKYIVHVGSVALDGISLTIASSGKLSFSVSVIPHTWDNTVLRYRRVGDEINIEFDILGKYVERQISAKNNGGITLKWLEENGF
jgi:riboflavin synthase